MSASLWERDFNTLPKGLDEWAADGLQMVPRAEQGVNARKIHLEVPAAGHRPCIGKSIARGSPSVAWAILSWATRGVSLKP